MFLPFRAISFPFYFISKTYHNLKIFKFADLFHHLSFSLLQVSGTAKIIKKKLIQCRDPIVVFVWFKETAYLLQKELTEHSLQESSEYSEIISKKCDDESIGQNYEKKNVKINNFFDEIKIDFDQSKLKCECFTGDIIKHEVSK